MDEEVIRTPRKNQTTTKTSTQNPKKQCQKHGGRDLIIPVPKPKRLIELVRKPFHMEYGEINHYLLEDLKQMSIQFYHYLTKKVLRFII